MRKTWQTAVVFGVAGFAALVAANEVQGPEVASVMHEKLTRSQKILEAVVTSDWVALETNARELERLTGDPRWTALKYPEYARHSNAFVRAVNALHQAAVQRDLEKTPTAFTNMTLQCVECHRYLARARTAEK